MHYYQHHIADYRKDTAHLSLLEHGIYRQLLDTYYLDEKPLSNDLAKLMRSHSVRSADEQQALQNVLTDFFELTENGYVHKKCDSLIDAFHDKSVKARESAMARWSNRNKASKQSDKKRNANALPTQTESNPIGMLTNNHKPITNNIITPEGVSEVVWNDFKSLRNKQKAPITQTVLNGLMRESLKANISLEQALTICCERGWRSFKADWDWKSSAKPEAQNLGTWK